MSVGAKLTKLQRKENFDTNPDPDPEWLLIYVICVVISNEARVMLVVTRYYTFYLINN